MVKGLKPNQTTVWLLHYLIKPRTLAEMIDELGIDERSVYRCLKAIETAQVGIEIFRWRENKQRYYCLFPRNFRLIQMSFSEDGKCSAILEGKGGQLEIWFNPFGLVPAAIAPIQKRLRKK